MAEHQAKKSTQTRERTFSSENALLLLAHQQTLFHDALAPENNGTPLFISIDEVGRGCLAGPVVVCTTLWTTRGHSDGLEVWYSHLRDSKKLSSVKRDALFKDFLVHGRLSNAWDTPPVCAKTRSESLSKPTMPAAAKTTLPLMKPDSVLKFGCADLQNLVRSNKSHLGGPMKLRAASIGAASAQEIDMFGITAALGLAATRALEELPESSLASVLFFDGNRPLALAPPWCTLPQLLVVQGDDLLKSISASSILAKVIRDRWMEDYSKSFPDFSFHENRGYGTEKHRQALSRLGPTPLHRISFLQNLCPELAP